jgi:kinesin family protein 6/9
MRRSNAVKVCVRTRPTQNFAQGNIYIEEEHSTIQINTADPSAPKDGLLDNKQSNFKFKFDHVFHNATQSAVYDLHARDTVQSVVDGINGAIMSYGQTGSGKTFTMVCCAVSRSCCSFRVQPRGAGLVRRSVFF